MRLSSGIYITSSFTISLWENFFSSNPSTSAKPSVRSSISLTINQIREYSTSHSLNSRTPTWPPFWPSTPDPCSSFSMTSSRNSSVMNSHYSTGTRYRKGQVRIRSISIGILLIMPWETTRWELSRSSLNTSANTKTGSLVAICSRRTCPYFWRRVSWSSHCLIRMYSTLSSI